MLIVFCGFMGAGKTFLLKRIDPKSYNVLDLDDLIEKKYGSIVNLVAQKGPEIFRKIETSTLLAQLQKSNLLLFTGGGTLNEKNIELILKKGKLVWIDTPFEECWSRIKNDQSRPLVSEGKERLYKLYRERLSFYQRADLRLDSMRQDRVNNTTDLLVQLDEAQRKD